MRIRMSCSLLLFLIGARGTDILAVEVTPPRVPGFERFYAHPPQKETDEDSEDDEPVKLNPEVGGRVLLSELNCTSCHAMDQEAKQRLSPKQAPILDKIGARVKVDWLRSYLANPHQTKPGTTMPDMIATLPEQSRSEAVEALTHFLASTGPLVDARSNAALARKGAAAFRSAGCRACHDSQDDGAKRLASSAGLPELGQKYTPASLMAFLKDPLKTRPSGRMPAMGLSDEDYLSIAHYFVQDGVSAPDTRFELFHGDWQKLPDFSAMKAVETGTCSGFDPAVSSQPFQYGVRYTSFVQLPKNGEYRFWLGSDDGSKLLIDDEVVVDCDGIHPHQTVQSRKSLTAGFHKVVVEYFQGGGEATLEVQIAGQGIVQQPLAGLLSLEPKERVPSASAARFTPDPELVTKGRELFSTIGCAACHQLHVEGELLPSRLKAPSFLQLPSDSGCLADTVTGAAPRYELTALQRSALALAIKSTAIESPAERIHRSLMTLNCYSCHQRNGIGGVERDRDDAFESRQKEMGDEGRLPPTLTGVGDKLRPDWLKHVLEHSSNDRKEYMVVRMPRFGPDNVGPLADLFEQVDLQPESMPVAEFHDPDYRVKAAGRHLVGAQALSCIKCHDFANHPSTGVRAINLTSMHKRLRPDWFYRYVLDPQAYRRGTRMPAPWPFGQTTVRDVLDANVNLQVQAVWRYLSDGEKAVVPLGLIREPIELKPVGEPIIYRNFIEGAGTRAIGVGYPEGVNLAFDANDLRLAMIWHGPFIDASRHWTGRGQGFESPLGDDVLPLPLHAPIARLQTAEEPFSTESGREQGGKFLGYRLDHEQRPLFRYSLAGLTIEDHAVPQKTGGRYATLKRTLRFEGPVDLSNLWFRAATARTIEPSENGRFKIDGVWMIELNPQSSDVRVRAAENGQELLIPLRLKGGTGTLELHYIW